MLILRLKSRNNNNGATLQPILSTIHTHFSTQPTQPTIPHFMVNYLVNSLGFSEPQALSTSTKLTHLKSTKNPTSVISFLKRFGLDNTQLKTIIFSCPKILTTNVDKTLRPKFKALVQLGLPESGLQKLVRQSSYISTKRLNENVGYLKMVLGCDEKVIKVVRRTWWLLSANYADKMSVGLMVLKRNGIPDDKVESMLLKNPVCFLRNPKWLEAMIKKVEPVLGVGPESTRFFDGLEMVMSMSDETLDGKFGVFRRFGWSDGEIRTMTRGLPCTLRGSEGKIQDTLSFFMRELGYTAGYLATHPKVLVYSLEKRVVPRHRVLEVLKEKKVLKNNFSLCSVVALSEKKFIEDFVMPYRECVPHLYEMYTSATGSLQKIN